MICLYKATGTSLFDDSDRMVYGSQPLMTTTLLYRPTWHDMFYWRVKFNHLFAP